MAEANGWQADTFSFSTEFQKEIIVSMIQEPKLFERFGLYIKPENFEVEEFRNVFKCLLSFFDKYKGLPTKEICHELVKEKYDKNNKPVNYVLETIEEIYEHKKISVANLHCIEDNVKQFISCQAIKQAILDSIDDLGDVSKHLNVKDRVEKALLVCSGLEDLGINVYDIDEIASRWIRRMQGNEVIRYSSNWSEFDKIFGGYGCGEVFTFAGPAHSGKSMYLINAGANLLLQKKNVLHISLEMSEEITAQRYDMRLLGLTKEELKTKVANQKVKELLQNTLGQIVIKRYPASTVTISEINMYVKRLNNITGFIPDVIIIDYADILRSSNKYNEKRFELEMIYQEVRNLAIEHNVPIITATQLNRSALEKLEAGKILTEENIAEAYGISRIVDCGVTINATPADNANNQSTIYVFKNRDGQSGSSWKMFVDFQRALVREWTAPNAQAIKNLTKRK